MALPGSGFPETKTKTAPSRGPSVAAAAGGGAAGATDKPPSIKPTNQAKPASVARRSPAPAEREPRIALKPREGVEPAAASGPYTVRVYKRVDGDWVQDEERTFTTRDPDKARRYLATIKGVAGWTATSNLPPVESPGSPSSAATASAKGDDLAGTSWSGRHALTVDGRPAGSVSVRYTFHPDGTLTFTASSGTGDKTFVNPEMTWTRQGDTVTIVGSHTAQVASGRTVLQSREEGVVSGDRIQGKGERKTQVYRADLKKYVEDGTRLAWTWDVTREK
jgi:hypothetical protein